MTAQTQQPQLFWRQKLIDSAALAISDHLFLPLNKQGREAAKSLKNKFLLTHSELINWKDPADPIWKLVIPSSPLIRWHQMKNNFNKNSSVEFIKMNDSIYWTGRDLKPCEIR